MVQRARQSPTKMGKAGGRKRRRNQQVTIDSKVKIAGIWFDSMTWTQILRLSHSSEIGIFFGFISRLRRY